MGDGVCGRAWRGRRPPRRAPAPYQALRKGRPLISLREETPADVPAIRRVNELAFGQPQEAGIVDALRVSCEEFVSLVAECEGEVVGHILFTTATIEMTGGAVRGMGLAPLAVLPSHQRQGIGSALVRHGIGVLRERGCSFIIVVGHAEYYPRFGFERASGYGIRCQWDGVPDDAFMILLLDKCAMEGVTGVARYRDEFNDAM